MLAVAFDTLKLARKLESAGFPAKQAQDASAALSESISEWHEVGNLATREDVQKVEVKISHLEIKISHLEVKISNLETKISESNAEILKWMFGAIGAQTFIILGALIGLLHSGAK